MMDKTKQMGGEWLEIPIDRLPIDDNHFPQGKYIVSWCGNDYLMYNAVDCDINSARSTLQSAPESEG